MLLQNSSLQPLTWAVKPIRGVFHLGISFSYWLGSSSVFFGVFTAEEVDSVGDKGSGDTTLEYLLKISLRSVCSIDEVLFVGKSKTSALGTTPPLPPWSASLSRFLDY